MTFWITLPPHTRAVAADEGTKRRELITGRDIGHKYQLTQDATLDVLTLNIQARGAEHALAIALDVQLPPYDGKADNARGDVAGHEVRSTTRPNGGLILHPEDADHLTAYLVLIGESRYGIVGSIRIGDGKRDEWWRTDIRYPCWIVPQRELDPFTYRYVPCGVCPGVMLPGYPPPHPWCRFGGWKPGDRIYGPPPEETGVLWPHNPGWMNRATT